MLKHYQRLIYLSLIITVVVAPTMVSLTWYSWTKDPNFRPLAVTREALRAYGYVGDGVEIIAMVDWVPSRAGNYTRTALTKALTESFQSKGVDVDVVFRPGADTTRVTYLIGKTALGPYLTSRAAEGVAAAVEAYRMH